MWLGMEEIRMGRALMMMEMLPCLSVDGGRAGSGGCRFGMGTELEGRVRRTRTCPRLLRIAGVACSRAVSSCYYKLSRME